MKNEFLATFHTYYGATSFNKHCKEIGVASKMQPVPRELSASCGACVRFWSTAAPNPAHFEDMENCYSVTPDEKYTLVASG